jgi:RND family efflux transporter MFP subunit
MGRIASLPVRVGDHVKKGEVVAEIDTEQLKANLAVAQSGVLNSRSQLAVAEAQLVLETTTRDRLAKLKQSPSFREASLEDANNRVSVASAAVEAAKSLIKVTEAEVARQQVNVNLATITAPFDGVVVRHLLTVGGLVSDYDSSILVMVDDSAPEIEIEIPIEYLSSVSVGMEMTYSLNSGRRQQAKVRAVLPSVTPNAKTRIVRLDPENLEARPTFSEVQLVTVYVPKT